MKLEEFIESVKTYRPTNIAEAGCDSGITIIKNNQYTMTARMPRMHSTVISERCTGVMSALCSAD